MCIGIFDSGIGGLTLLHQAMVMMPHEKFIFYADTDHVPYGTKDRGQVVSYVDDIMGFMVSRGCKAVVIACNTATAVAARQMREKYARLPIIGIEPAVKPAVAESEGKRVLVIATPLTVNEKKLLSLLERVDDAHLVDLLALPGLVVFAERGEFESDAVTDYLAGQLAPYALENYGELVLGCTHFNYFKDTLGKLMPPGVRIIDGILGTVRQLARVLDARGELAGPVFDGGTRPEIDTNVRYFESGREITDPFRLERIKKLHARLEEMRQI